MLLGKERGLGPGHIVLDGDPVGTQPLPTFRPMSVVTKRSPISVTAELLLDLLLHLSTTDFLKRISSVVTNKVVVCHMCITCITKNKTIDVWS